MFPYKGYISVLINGTKLQVIEAELRLGGYVIFDSTLLSIEKKDICLISGHVFSCYKDAEQHLDYLKSQYDECSKDNIKYFYGEKIKFKPWEYILLKYPEESNEDRD